MADKIRTVIVDDEPLARRNLRLLLEKDPQIEIVEECGNGREATVAGFDLSRHSDAGDGWVRCR